MNAIPLTELKALLLAERLASYRRLKGGFPIPLAGAAYWAALAVAGSALPIEGWVATAMWGSGLIFPLALVFAKLFGADFMRDRTAVGDVLPPAFISMLLFWPIMVGALWSEPQLAPLVLGIGMAIHWPVIGWSYGRTGLFTAHALVRAAAVFAIWHFVPEARFTILPLAVSLIYLATVGAILLDLRRDGRSKALTPAAPTA